MTGKPLKTAAAKNSSPVCMQQFIQAVLLMSVFERRFEFLNIIFCKNQ